MSEHCLWVCKGSPAAEPNAVGGGGGGGGGVGMEKFGNPWLGGS